MEQAKLIDEVLKRLDVPSDYALARRWGIAHNTVSQYRTGKRQFDAYMLNRVAEALDKDPRELLALQALANEPTGERRKWWETVLKKSNGATRLGVCTALCIATSSIVAGAIPTLTRAPNTDLVTFVQIMRHLRRTLWRSARCFTFRLAHSPPVWQD